MKTREEQIAYYHGEVRAALKESGRQWGIAMELVGKIRELEGKTPDKPACLLGFVNGMGCNVGDGAPWTYGCNRFCLTCFRKEECLKTWEKWREKEHESGF